MVDLGTPQFAQGLHMRGLLEPAIEGLTAPDYSDSLHHVTVLENTVLSIDGREVRLASLNCLCALPPPPYLRRTVDALEDGQFSYPCFFAEWVSAGTVLRFLAAPFKELLAFIHPVQAEGYFAVDIAKIANQHYWHEPAALVRITRLNAQLWGVADSEVTSIALYGSNVSSAQLLTDLVGAHQYAPRSLEVTPFLLTSKSLESRAKPSSTRWLKPNSCRLTWEKKPKPPFSVNVDSYGNYAFYARGTEDFGELVRVLEYAKGLSSIRRVGINPLDRSEVSIQEVSQ